MGVIKRRPVPTTQDKETEASIAQRQGGNLEGTPRDSFITQLKQRQEKNNLEKEVEDNMNKENIQEESKQEENIQEEASQVDNQKENKEEIRIGNVQETNKNHDLEGFQAASSKTTSRSNLIAGVMSIVNSNSGKRVTVSKELLDKLNNPTKVEMSFSEESIAIGVTLPNNNNQLTIKHSGKKGVIYSAGIVSEITDKYGLNFQNRTSITFSQVDYIEAYGSTIAIINTKQMN